MRILVTGGAGYIGSCTCARLLASGHEVRVIDDLSTGHREAVPEGCELVVGRLQDASVLRPALEGIEAVVHFASLSLVGDSVRRPRHYFRENLGGALSLLDQMAEADVRRIVFSSSAAVYGEPEAEVLDESTRLRPVNPYGHSKQMIERFLEEEARAAGLAAISLRYFNACGADGPRGEDHRPETHLIPRLCQHCLGELEDFSVYGDDFPTPDGTAVRDYVHVRDLARAHAAALVLLEEPGFEAINLGTGTGASVREVLRVASEQTGHALEVGAGPRRPGDPPRLVASRQRAAERLGWEPEESGLDRILADAWRWHREHPRGYRD